MLFGRVVVSLTHSPFPSSFLSFNIILSMDEIYHTILFQFQQFFPSAVESILSDDARGDFISLIYRQPTDDRVLAETFDSSWAAAGRSEFEIESFGLPFADLSSVPQENLALMYQFLRSDHANFWEANLPAIFLTDSGNV